MKWFLYGMYLGFGGWYVEWKRRKMNALDESSQEK